MRKRVNIPSLRLPSLKALLVMWDLGRHLCILISGGFPLFHDKNGSLCLNYLINTSFPSKRLAFWYVIDRGWLQLQVSLEKWLILDLGQEIYKMNLKHLIIQENNWRLVGLCQKNWGANLKRLPLPKLGNLSISQDDHQDGLEQIWMLKFMNS